MVVKNTLGATWLGFPPIAAIMPNALAPPVQDVLHDA